MQPSRGNVFALASRFPLTTPAEWLKDVINYSNKVRLHSAIGYIAPVDKLNGRDQELFVFYRISRFFKYLTRPKVIFNDLRRPHPISNIFGFDRGTPIDRFYIEKFLHTNKHHITGKVLEVAESKYADKFGIYFQCEILHIDNSNKKATIIGDLTKHDTLPINEIDCFICTQTYHLIYDVKVAIKGSYNLLKKNGVLLATVPCISQISRWDMDRWGDYWRFTDKSIMLLMKEAGFSRVEIISFGNTLSAIAFLQGIAVEDLPDIKLLEIEDSDYQVIIGIVAQK